MTDKHEFAEIARAQAGTYGFLAMIFNQRPDAPLVYNLKAMGVEIFARLRQGEGLNPEVQEGLAEISHFIDQIKQQPEKDIEQSLQVDWTRLFRGVQRGYGPQPPYEALYLGEGEAGLGILESISRDYIRCGVAPTGGANRPDYIGLECEFLRYVCEQQTEAWEKGEEEDAQRWQSAENSFLSNHLGRWAAIYCDNAMEHARTGFYRGFLHVAKAVIAEMQS